MLVRIHNAGTTCAGYPVQRGDESPTDLRVQGTAAELLEYARGEIRLARHSAADLFHRRVARTILEALGYREGRILRELYPNKRLCPTT